jgi:hypothetical protein
LRTYDFKSSTGRGKKKLKKVCGWRFSKLRFFILTKCELRRAEERRRRGDMVVEKETTRVR